MIDNEVMDRNVGSPSSRCANCVPNWYTALIAVADYNVLYCTVNQMSLTKAKYKRYSMKS